MSEPNPVKEHLKVYFETVPDVMLVYLFGSQVKHRTGPMSDVDVAVVFDETVGAFDYLRRRLDLMVELTSFLKREVDIVVLNEAPPLLGHRVIAGGTLILCRDEVFRVRLETRVVAEYVDNLPLHEEYNRVLTERIKGGRFLG